MLFVALSRSTTAVKHNLSAAPWSVVGVARVNLGGDFFLLTHVRWRLHAFASACACECVFALSEMQSP